MGAFIYKDAEVTVNGVDLSDHVLSATLNYSGDLQEQTAMGDGTRTRLSGLKDWSMEFSFKQDYDSGSVDGTLFALVGGAAVVVTVRALDSAGVGETNPTYSGSAVLESYPPLSGAVGELASTTVTFQSAGTLSRLTA